MSRLKHPIQKILDLAYGRERSEPSRAAPSTQLSLDIQREFQADRNFDRGGRSFYFFDFDDNVAFLSTSIYLFHKESGEEIAVSSGQFAQFSDSVGKTGPFKDYRIDFDDNIGSFRNFRDRHLSLLDRVLGKKQSFVRDVLGAVSREDFRWKGPSWDCFYHAVFNKRPLAVITARGHDPQTIKAGISEFVRSKHLPHEPNYLNIYPVSHSRTRYVLGDAADETYSVADLKKKAIIAAVERAFAVYGANPHHRFGMSDDDQNNINLIIEAMIVLKERFPENSFFVFDSSRGALVKREIFREYVSNQEITRQQQMSLFGED